MCIYIEVEISDTCAMDKLLAAFERLKSGYKSRSSVILFDFWTWFSNMQKSMLLYVSTLDCCWSGTFAASETMQAMSSKKQKVVMRCTPYEKGLTEYTIETIFPLMMTAVLW